MKTSAGVKEIKKDHPNPLLAIPVDNDLKKYADDPVAVRKKERAIELLKQIGRLK